MSEDHMIEDGDKSVSSRNAGSTSAATPKSAAPEVWRGSRPDMASYDGMTGEQVSFIYLPDGSRLAVGGGGDPVEQAAAIIAAHNAAIAEEQS